MTRRLTVSQSQFHQSVVSVRHGRLYKATPLYFERAVLRCLFSSTDREVQIIEHHASFTSIVRLKLRARVRQFNVPRHDEAWRRKTSKQRSLASAYFHRELEL